MKPLNIMTILALIIIAGCIPASLYKQYDYVNYPGSGITDQQYYKDKSDCQYKWQIALDHGQSVWAKELIIGQCMRAYKKVEIK